nr:hypothetical protein OH837_00910 [Streptomyces canus]
MTSALEHHTPQTFVDLYAADPLASGRSQARPGGGAVVPRGMRRVGRTMCRLFLGEVEAEDQWRVRVAAGRQTFEERGPLGQRRSSLC